MLRGSGRGRNAGGLRRAALGAAGAAAVVLIAACGSSGSGSGSGTDAAADPKLPVPATTTAAPIATPATAATLATPGATTASATAPPNAAAPEGYDPARDAAADIAAARRSAAADGRPVLLDFGADWCPDCVVLGKTFTEPDTAGLLAKYHVVRVDVGDFDHNLDVAAQYVELRSSGIPALAVVDAHGKLEVATNQGQFANARDMPAAEVNAFLKKWA
ncbi:thioredoxin family protein [Streptomyces sp. NPDC020917]|uniref:thioredoxin family protein n=1 Tax=Streptomyces sp. NPDC020917 TaxID=3365102 RepID=UPI0037938DA9